MKELQAQFKIIIEWFHNGLIDINQLEKIMLILNPYPKNSKICEWVFYNQWVQENIQLAKNGSTYILSLTSSGGMYESFND